MEIKVNILKPFFENPSGEFYIRELSRILKINHTSVRQYLNQLVKEGYLAISKGKVYSGYRLVSSRKMLNLKLYYNLEKLRMSGLIESFEKLYDFPVIILFGSYALGTDDLKSDIDICIISDIEEKELRFEKYEKVINRKISIHKFTKKSWKRSVETNPGLINNICNGIVLSGELEVLQ